MRDTYLVQVNAHIERCLASIEAEVRYISRKVDRMSEREDKAYAELNATILTVKDGWASLIAERDQWKAAAEAAGGDVATQVQAALDADSEVDADKVEAADAALAELVAPAPEPEPAPE